MENETFKILERVANRLFDKWLDYAFVPEKKDLTIYYQDGLNFVHAFIDEQSTGKVAYIEAKLPLYTQAELEELEDEKETTDI